MALAAIEAPCSIFFSSHPYAKLHPCTKSPSSIRFRISLSVPAVSLNFVSYTLSPALQTARKSSFKLQSSVETTVSVEEKVEQEPKPESRRKLFVQNLPWSFSVVDIKKLFGECGVVDDVEIIKRKKDGKSRGFAFVTMSTAEEAQAAIEKFDSSELVGRTITVQFSKRFKRPAPVAPEDTPAPQGQTSHKLYVSNLQWKARSNDLREFFSSAFNPVSARVVFENDSRSAGYGFVAFATKEEAESAISALDGKELLGRPIRLKLSERNTSSSESEDETSSEQDVDTCMSKEEEEEPSKQQTTEES